MDNLARVSEGLDATPSFFSGIFRVFVEIDFKFWSCLL